MLSRALCLNIPDPKNKGTNLNLVEMFEQKIACLHAVIAELKKINKTVCAVEIAERVFQLEYLLIATDIQYEKEMKKYYKNEGSEENELSQKT